MQPVTILNFPCQLRFNQYDNNTICIDAFYGDEHIATCTVNWEQNFEADNYSERFAFPAVVIKNYSENEGMVQALITANVIQRGGAYLAGSGGSVSVHLLTPCYQNICKRQLAKKAVRA